MNRLFCYLHCLLKAKFRIMSTHWVLDFSPMTGRAIPFQFILQTSKAILLTPRTSFVRHSLYSFV